jgi:hypothetical protein
LFCSRFTCCCISFTLFGFGLPSFCSRFTRFCFRFAVFVKSHHEEYHHLRSWLDILNFREHSAPKMSPINMK